MSTRYIVRFGNDYPGAGSASGSLIRAPYSGGESGEYPIAVGGVTLGRVPGDDDVSVGSAPGWQAGTDEVVRGQWIRANADAPVSYRIAPPDGSGAYRVWYGTAVAYTPRWRHRIADGVGGAVRSDVSYVGGTGYPSDAALDADEPNGPAWRQWVDHAGVVRAMSSDVFASISEPLEVEVSSGALVITNGGHASGAFMSRLSFIAFEKVSGDPPPPPPGLSPLIVRRRRTVIL